MASEIRANTIKNRVGLGTVSYTDTGIVVSGIVTANSFSGPFTGDLDVDGHTNLDNVSVAGVSTFSSDVYLLDNDHLRVGGTAGTQDGMDIYHSGTHSYIRDIGTGRLIIQSSQLCLQDLSGNNHFIANPGGSVQIYHDFANNITPKLETTATGINVTGGAVFTSTNAGSAAEPEVVLYRNSASPADADYLGQIKFNGKSDTGAQRTYAKITGKILDASNSTEDGIIEFAHIKGGSQNISARFRSDSLQLLNGTSLTVAGTTTLSDSLSIPVDNKYIKLGAGDDLSFVHTGGQSYITNATGHLTGRSASYTWENFAGSVEYARIGSNGRVGIGTNNPESKVHIYDASVDPYLKIGGSGRDCGIILHAGNSFQALRTDGASRLWVNAHSDSIRFTTGGTSSSNEKLQINANGNSTFTVGGGTLKVEGTGAYGLSIHNTNSPSMGHLFIFGDNGLIRFRNSSSVYTAQMGYAESNNSLYFTNQEAGTTLNINADGVQINDNEKFLCGNDKDLEIYHNNSNAYIKNGTGQLLYRSSTHTFENANGATELFRISDNGFVGINEANSRTGLTIGKQSDYNSTDGNTYYVPEGKWSVAWNSVNGVSSNTDYWVGFIGGYHQSGNSVNISLSPNRGNLNAQQGMYISGEATAISSSDIAMGYISGGGQLGQGTSGGQRATKVELLRLKSNGNMGLGVSPVYSGIFGGSQKTLHIGGSAAPCLRITSSTSGQTDLVIHAGNSGRRADIANMTANGHISIWTKPSSGSIAERIKIHPDGYVTKPATPAFFATHTNTSSTHTGTLTYNTSGNGYYNNGSHLDVATGRFHAPVDGIYSFHFHGFFQVNTSTQAFEVTMTRRNSNGSGSLSLTRQYGYRHTSNQYGPSISMHCTTYLTAGQTVEIITSAPFHGANGYYFGGHLAG